MTWRRGRCRPREVVEAETNRVIRSGHLRVPGFWASKSGGGRSRQEEEED
jgi:hypothetical protein